MALTAYELEREARVSRNKTLMTALGLFDSDVSAAAAQRSAQSKPKPEAAAAKRKAAVPAGDRADVRRSRRVAGSSAALLEPEERAPAAVSNAGHEEEAAEWDARHAGAQGRQSVVGTASYAHTLMRVKSMSEKGLLGRLAAIERAKGKHAVTKMRLFARVLLLEGYEDLAAQAVASLQRLVALLGDAEEES